MSCVSRIALLGHKLEKQKARESLAQGYDISARSEAHIELLQVLKTTRVGDLDRKVKHGENLTFAEAFCGMCYVLSATNQHFFNQHKRYFELANGGTFSQMHALALASAFINLMATKESLSALTEHEIAGMATASTIDVVARIDLPRVTETCGMGGDKGFVSGANVKKSINLSTLSSLVLAGLGLSVIKHGSYGNTSKVGSTEAIELFGAKTSMWSVKQMNQVMEEGGYCYFDAHNFKTLHDLSHLLMMETINHIIGPMTTPITYATEITKVMGVNEKVHPETIARAYALLHGFGLQKVGGVIAIAGLSQADMVHNQLDHQSVRMHTIMDELSPYRSVVSISYKDKHLGTHIISPEDFGICLDHRHVQIPNDKEAVRKANIEALTGQNPHLVDYLSMNAALGLFATEYLPKGDSVQGGLNGRYLVECFGRCRSSIQKGQAKRALAQYVTATGGTLTL